MRLELPFPGFGCQGSHVLADGSQALDVSVEDDGGDEPCGSAHRHTHIHHVIPATHTAGEITPAREQT